MAWWNPFFRQSAGSLMAVFDYQSNVHPSDKSRAADVACAKLAAYGAAAVTPLVAQLGHKNHNVGFHCVDALKRIGSPAVPALLAAAESANVEIRRNAIRCLGLIGDPVATDALILKLADRDYDVRNGVVKALGNLRQPRAVDPLLEALQDRDRFYAADVIEALGKLRDPRAVEPIIAKRHFSLWQAAIALGQIGDARAVDTLVQIMQGKDGNAFAATALGEIGDGRAIEPLRGVLNSEDERLHNCAAAALLKLGDRQGLPRLVELLSHSSVNDRFDQEIRETILAFGHKDRNAYVTYFSELLQPPNNAGARLCAAEFLSRVGEVPPAPLVRSILLDWLEFAAAKRGQTNEGVTRVASVAGMDTDLLELARTALGYTVKSKHGKSSGGNFSWSSLESYDGGMSAIETLCRRKDLWSSCILFRVARRKDASVTMTTCAPSSYEVPLSFEREREAARQELVRRGIGATDPLSQL